MQLWYNLPIEGVRQHGLILYNYQQASQELCLA